jgi:uracil permease
VVISLCIKVFGVAFLHRLLPPVVVGPVIMVIGLILAPVAVFMAMGKTGDGSVVLVPQNKALIVSMVTLGTTIGVSLLARGMLRLIPILVGILVGYVISVPMGLIDLGPIGQAAWFAVPDFVLPKWNLQAVLYIVPVAIAPAIEHFGDILAIGQVTGRDYLEKPGIHRTMMGDGLATTLAAAVGGPPNTTYSEVTGAVALTRMFNPAIMTWAAIFAILLAFVGKVGAILQTIPVPVMGGIMLLLFGAITVVGLNSLVRAGEDLTEPRNLAIVALILVFGIGGMAFSVNEYTLKGIGLAGIAGVLLNLILPGNKKRAAQDQPPAAKERLTA